MPRDVVPDVTEDFVPCLSELRGNGHLIVAEVASMVLRLVGVRGVLGAGLGAGASNNGDT
jgi:hypothetical protein